VGPQKVESQMAEEKKTENKWLKKRFLAFGRIYKWPNLNSSGFGQCHRVIVELRSNYKAVVKSFRVFEKNHEFCINLNFFYIFRNIG
jgi:hypothetical protein